MDNERNNPQSGTADGDALSFDQGVNALENLFSPPVKKPEQAKAKPVEEKATVEPEPPATDDASATQEDEGEDQPAEEQETEGAEESDDTDETENAKEPVVALDDMLVSMPDGTRLTVADLRQHGLRQSDYTRKTQEVQERNRVLEQQETRVLDSAKQVRAERELILQFAQEFLPQPPKPDLLREDPVAYLEQQEAYRAAAQRLEHMHQQSQAAEQRSQAEQQQRVQEWAASQQQLLVQHHPELNKPEIRAKIERDVGDTMRELGFSDQEWSSVRDHRVLRAMILASKMLKLQKAKPGTVKAVAEKPKMLKPGNRQTTSKASKAQAAFDKQRKTGSLEDSVNALLQFDL